MSHWDDSSVPKYGWTCDFVEDLADDGGSKDYADCWMCGREEIRYVHHLSHAKYADVIEVGCICAGKLTGDVQGSEARETKMKNRAARKAKWTKRTWKSSANGNPRLNTDGMFITVFPKGSRFSFCVDGQFSDKTYPTEDAAKTASFDPFWQRLQAFSTKHYDNLAEANWGCFFAHAGWKAEYKPSPFDGWQPTFIIRGTKRILVKVELEYQIGEQYFKWFEANNPSIVQYDLLFVGRQPYQSRNWDHLMLGWTNELYEDGSDFDEAPFVNDEKGKLDFCHATGSYHGRITGYYEGGRWPLSVDPMAKWRESLLKLRA